MRISSDFNALQLSVTAIKRQDRLVFLGGLAVERTEQRNDIQPGAAITPTTGAFVALSPQTSLRFLFSATFQDETKVDGDDISGSDHTAATFTIGASSLLAEGVLTNVSLDIGLTDDADDFAVRWALPVRFRRTAPPRVQADVAATAAKKHVPTARVTLSVQAHPAGCSQPLKQEPARRIRAP